MLRNFAKEITGNKPGKLWPGRFIKRHQHDLISTYTTAIDAARKRADSAYKYTLYFEGGTGRQVITDCIHESLKDQCGVCPSDILEF
jgi:hypothetical protein